MNAITRETSRLTYGQVSLRPVEESDLWLLKDLLNDPDISYSVVDYGFPVSYAMQYEWYKKVFPYENAYRFIIDAEGVTVGSIVFGKIDPENKTGELGFKILRAFQRKNYASSAIRAMMRYLFEEKDVGCIISYHFKMNEGSKRALEKVGFCYEGIVRKAVYKNGQRQDLCYWSCSREHFVKIRKDQVVL